MSGSPAFLQQLMQQQGQGGPPGAAMGAPQMGQGPMGMAQGQPGQGQSSQFLQVLMMLLAKLAQSQGQGAPQAPQAGPAAMMGQPPTNIPPGI